MAFFRYLLPVAAVVAAAGAAVVVAKRYLDNREDDHIVGEEAFEDAVSPVTDAPEATEPQPDPAADAVTAPAEEPAPAQEVPAEPAAPVAKPDDEAPNANPVRDTTEPVPTTEDGKLDVTKIASPEDFGNWDDLGCQG